jgi:hypothetical protein
MGEVCTVKFCGAFLDDCRTGGGDEGIVDFARELALEIGALPYLLVEEVELAEAAVQAVVQIESDHFNLITLGKGIATANYLAASEGATS